MSLASLTRDQDVLSACILLSLRFCSACVCGQEGDTNGCSAATPPDVVTPTMVEKASKTSCMSCEYLSRVGSRMMCLSSEKLQHALSFHQVVG